MQILPRRTFDYKPLINMEQAMKESLPWLRNLNPSLSFAVVVQNTRQASVEI